MATVELPFGPCNVEVTGQGPALLLVHGVLVNRHLWDAVAPEFAAAGYQVIAPDLPLGGHSVPAKRRDLVQPEGVADALVALLDALGERDAVVIGSDTGGAISQIMTARHPERVRALVLASCDAFNHFLPTLFKPVRPMLAIPGFVDLVAFAYRSKRVRRSPLGAGLVVTKPYDDELLASFFDPLCRDRDVRRDFAAFLRRCRSHLTVAAAETLRTYERPALLAWSRGAPLFPDADAEKLASMLPNATLRWIDGAKAFSMIDQPARFTELVLEFLAGLDDK